MFTPMLAFLTNLDLSEFVVILVVAVLIFGRRLPEVAAKGAVQLQRLRRGMQEFRRESGFDDEMRRARKLIENPIKGALEEAEREPASWRPPSPRVEPHPEAFASEVETDVLEEDSDSVDQVSESPPESDAISPPVQRQGIIQDEEPDAHS